MIPTTPGSYEFKGFLEHLYHGLPPKTYPQWSLAEVYRNEIAGRLTGRLSARVLDEDGHYSAADLDQFAGEWRHTSFVTLVDSIPT